MLKPPNLQRTLGIHSAVLLLVVSWAVPARAWLFFEHARIAKSAVQSLDANSAALFQEAWAHAQHATPHYCAQADAGTHFYVPGEKAEYCVDVSALTAISADHSCSPADATAALNQDYVLRVLRVAEETEVELREASTERAHVDVWHSQNIDLQVADPAYLTRAQGNGAHFQLPSRDVENQRADNEAEIEARKAERERCNAAGCPPAAAPPPADGLGVYLRRVLADGAPMNAIGLYVNFHVAALQGAERAARGCTVSALRLDCPVGTAAEDQERDKLFALAIADEAFALHFLEDAFSSGHMSSQQGGDSVRMGTHDFYCQHGLPARTWDGQDTYVAHGDSFMNDGVDLPRARRAVMASLDSFLHALKGDVRLDDLNTLKPRGDFDICHGTDGPTGLTSVASSPWVDEALPLTVRPVMDPPGVQPDSNELGLFLMPNAQLALRVGVEDLAGTNKDKFLTFARWPIRLRAGMGIGFTAAGVTNDHQDGTGWLEAHVIFDGRPPGSRIGTRFGAGASFHLPYFVIPGDLIPLAVLGLFDSEAYLKTAIRASGAGLLGLEGRHHVFNNWTFQCVLGREASFDLMPSPQMDVSHTALSLTGAPGYWQLGVPVLSLTTVHVSEGTIGLDAAFELGYDLTRYVKSEAAMGGANSGDLYQGIFLSYGYAGRHYVWSPE